MSVSVQTGQLVIAVTGTAVTVPCFATPNGGILKAKDTNNSSGVFLSNLAAATRTDTGAGDGYRLLPGEAISIGGGTGVPAGSLSFNGTAGDILYYIWS